MDEIEAYIKGLKDDAVFEAVPVRIRQDNEGYYIVINFEKRSFYSVNKSMIEIISICDGKKTVKETVEKYAERFPNIDINIIEKDIKYVLMKSLQFELVSSKEGCVNNENPVDCIAGSR